ncbi:MAG TPA: transposase [Candidatus Tectomicrobia bacterium]
MTISITDEEWDELTPENFDPTALLRAVDAVDELRGDLNDGEDGSPPQLRTDLLKLHQLAMAVINRGARGQAPDLFDLAVELEDQVLGLISNEPQPSESNAAGAAHSGLRPRAGVYAAS